MYRYSQQRLQDVSRVLNGESTGSHIISMREALAIAKGELFLSGSATPEQRKLVDLVTQAQATPLGREMTARAAQADVWLAVDNNIDGGAYYRDSENLIALEIRDDGTGGDGLARNLALDRASSDNTNLLSLLYHEMGHFYQARVWENLNPPPGLRSMDQKLWTLSTEAQVIGIEREALRQHGFNVPAEDRYSQFFETIRTDDFHKRFYAVSEGRFDDGNALSSQAYARAFGFIPGTQGNFLEGRLQQMADIYTQVGLPAPSPGQAAVQARPDLDIILIQQSLKNKGLFDGEPTGMWTDQTTQAFARYLVDAQTKGLADRTYTGRLDALYGPRTALSLARQGEDESLIASINTLYQSGELKAYYQRPADYRSLGSDNRQQATTQAAAAAAPPDARGSFSRTLPGGLEKESIRPVFQAAHDHAARTENEAANRPATTVRPDSFAP